MYFSSFSICLNLLVIIKKKHLIRYPHALSTAALALTGSVKLIITSGSYNQSRFISFRTPAMPHVPHQPMG